MADGEARTDESQHRSSLFPGFPLDDSVDSQVLAVSTFPPSPPSEPPDIRNWFSSYEYESTDSSVLPFELGSCVPESGMSVGPGRIGEMLIGSQHALSYREESPLQPPGFQPLLPLKLEEKNTLHGCLNSRKNPDEGEKVRCVNGETLVQDRSDCNQFKFHRGESSPNGESIAVKWDQDAQSNPSGSESHGFQRFEDGDADQDNGVPPTPEVEIKRSAQFGTVTSTDNAPKQASLDRGKPAQRVLLASEVCSTKLFHGNRLKHQERGHITAKSDVPPPPPPRGSENSPETYGDLPRTWVSTRVYSCLHATDENLPNGDLIAENSKHPRTEEHAPVSARTALVDKTNIANEATGGAEAPEVSGKWQCTRRNKTRRGPPLKQLRLERWVRRIL